MKFNFNMNRIRFRVGRGQRGESRIAVICITRGNGALNGDFWGSARKQKVNFQHPCAQSLHRLAGSSPLQFLQLEELRRSNCILDQSLPLPSWQAWAFSAPNDSNRTLESQPGQTPALSRIGFPKERDSWWLFRRVHTTKPPAPRTLARGEGGSAVLSVRYPIGS